MILDLIYNLSVLVALSVLSGFIDTRFNRKTKQGKIYQGLLFGLVSIIGMLYPFKLAPGIIFDGRSIVVSLCSLFFGPLAGAISAMLAILFRLYLGGSGALTGSLVITASFLIGQLFYFLRKKEKLRLNNLILYLFGLMTSATMMILMLTLPKANIAQTFETITLTVMTAYPIITVVIGKILIDQEENRNSIEKIKKEESLFKTTVNSILDGIIITDINGFIQYINPVAQEILGWNDKEIKGLKFDNIIKIVNKENQKIIENPLSFFIQKENIKSSALRLLLINRYQKEIPITCHGSFIEDENGEKSGVVFSITDKTLELEYQNKILQSQLKYSRTLDVVNDAIWEWKAGEQDELYTPNLNKILGYFNITFSKIEDLFYFSHPEDTEKLKKVLSDSVENAEGFDIDIRMKRKVGDWIWIQMKGRVIEKNKDGKAKLLIGTFSDITERKKAEEELIISENRYRTFINATDDFVFLKDDNLRYLFINEANARFVNKKIEDIIGKTDFDIFPYDVALNCQSTDKKALLEKRLIIEEESVNNQIFEVRKFPVEIGKNKIGVGGVIRDITQRKTFEAELIAAKEKAEENDRLKSAFLANISHEIRTPMNGILGFIDLLKTPNLSEDKREKYYHMVHLSGQRLLNTIYDIIEISKIDTGQVILMESDINVNEKMDYYYDMFFGEVKQKGLKFEIKKDVLANNLILRTDNAKLDAIFINLLKNAIKFTDIGKIEFGYKLTKSYLEFFVKDTGIGIPKELHTEIFKRFYRTDLSLSSRYEGSGLGLSIVKEFVKLLDGELRLESEVGEGSTFYFSFPTSKIKI